MSNSTITRVVGAAVAAVATVAMATACMSPQPDDAETSSQNAPAQQWDPDSEPSSPPTTVSPPNITTPSAKSTLPPSVRVDRSDAKDVAATAVELWFTWDTRTDQSRSDASARTAPLLSRAMSDAVLSDVSLRPSAQWREWAAREAIITPTVTAQGNQGAPTSPTRKYFVFSVTQTARTSSGTVIGTPERTTVWVITSKTSSGWEVTQIQEQQ